MKKDDCFELGIITKIHSFKGEVILFLDTDRPQNYYNIEHLFLEINKQLVPFFIEKRKVQKTQSLRVKFEGINTEDEALSITNKKAFLPLSSLPQLNDDQFYYHEIIGFTITDAQNKVVGQIIEVIDNSANRLVSVSINNKEALLPFNDNHILKVDKPNQTIQLEIPEGLLELYQ
ncbi:MAG: ribosome maturation factor RimM [Flavobacteriales bacterium]|jgi:16S rRNA processing protein RimM|nr:ribosome maturation factor RimM [Flavobacteriales bacterium]